MCTVGVLAGTFSWPCLFHSGVQAAAKPKRKYTKRAEKWKHTKKAQQGAGGAGASPEGAAAAPEAPAAADAAMQEGVLSCTCLLI